MFTVVNPYIILRYDVYMVVLLTWLFGYLVELSIFTPFIWKIGNWLTTVFVINAVVTSLAIIIVFPPYYSIVVLPLTCFRIINLLRIVQARMQSQYLLKSTRRTDLFLLGYHLLGFGLLFFLKIFELGEIGLFVLLLQLLTALCLLTLTARNIAKLGFSMPNESIPHRDLPTVTVAIPARNETKDLEDCLRSVLASDYPKLEVLVLDDCSQAKTAEIIKSFAQEGVRFIKGEEPDERWLAKNHAYQKLYTESNGKLILFCGVDVRFGLRSIMAMVNLLQARNKKMLSVLPLRIAGEPHATIIQPMRYWWELSLPRRLFNRPAVLGTCWLIDRASLKELGGFSSVSHSIQPEGYFARELVKTDAYSFVRSSEELEVRTQKSFAEQRATAIRARYPSLRRRPEAVFLVTLGELIIFVAPLATVIVMIITNQIHLMSIPLATVSLVLATHLSILQITNPANVAISVLTFPLAVITELIIMYMSMYRYEFGIVKWKDRNVCIPVMHTYPRLPKV